MKLVLASSSQSRVLTFSSTANLFFLQKNFGNTDSNEIWAVIRLYVTCINNYYQTDPCNTVTIILLRTFYSEHSTPNILLRKFYSKHYTSNILLRTFYSENYTSNIILRTFFSEHSTPKIILLTLYSKHSTPKIWNRTFYPEHSILYIYISNSFQQL